MSSEFWCVIAGYYIGLLSGLIGGGILAYKYWPRNEELSE